MIEDASEFRRRNETFPMFGAMLWRGVFHEKSVADEVCPLIPGFQPDIPVKQRVACGPAPDLGGRHNSLN
jgi:hypothetical protein